MHVSHLRAFSVFLGLLLSLPLFARPIILMDAGSTGTRLYLYEVEGSEVKQLLSVKAKPGLSSIDLSQPQRLDDYFYALLKPAAAKLDKNTLVQTPLTLYATAGVRMLPADQQNNLITAARLALGNQAAALGFPVPNNDQVRVISGTEEAVFVWAADNYLNGSLARPLIPGKTLGALEMGGGSSEIAYSSRLAKQDVLSLKSQGVFQTIYGQGYDGWGANAALDQMAASGDPQFAACFPVGAPYPLTDSTLTGTGDLKSCVMAIKREMIDPTAFISCTKKTPGQCSGLGKYQPPAPLLMQYQLTSAFYYLFNTLGLADQPVTQARFLDAAQGYCSMDWNSVQSTHPDQAANYLINYCFTAALSKVLFDAWNIPEAAKLRAVSEVNKVPVEWPLGAVILTATH
jgi:hypothetical protein